MSERIERFLAHRTDGPWGLLRDDIRAELAKLQSLQSLAREMLDFEAPAFEADLHVDAGDLVDAFAGWRVRLKAALA